MHHETYNSCQALRQGEVELPEAFLNTTFRLQAELHERQTVDLEYAKYKLLNAAERCFLLFAAVTMWCWSEIFLRHEEVAAAPPCRFLSPQHAQLVPTTLPTQVSQLQ